jgi:type I restriction enzyme S subunit
MKRKEISTTENTENADVDAAAPMRSVANTEDLPDGFQMTELGPLPEEWRVVRLGEVAAITSGGSAPQGGQYFLNGKNPFVRVQHLDIDGDYVRRWDLITDEAVEHYRLKKFPAGTIVFPKSGAAIRLEKRAILLVDAYIVSHLCAVLPKTSKVDRWFIFYSLRAKRLAEDKAEGYPVLNLSEICDVPIPLPPLPEQRAIAHVLQAVQRAKEATEGVIAALKELKKSLMQHLFTYGPAPVGAKNFSPQRETELGPLPKEWRVVRLGEIARVKYGKAKPINEHGNIPVIGSGGIYGWTAEAAVDFATLIIGRKGTAGQVWLSETPSWPSDTTFYLEWKSHTTVDVRFIYGWFLLNPLSGEHAKTTIPSLQRPDLENSLVPLPPLAEQREIARMLQAVDAKIAAEERRRAALEELFKSLLHELMSGRIRVPNIVGGQRSCDSAPDADPLPESED